MKQAHLPHLRPEEYLAGEQDSPVRHEYVAGQVFAMAGAGEAHNIITGNVFARLRERARGTACRVFVSDMKIRVPEYDAFHYPDVSVCCDPDDREPYYKTRPCVIVEVLSPRTESIDRREKLLAYRTLPSLRAYVLISQEARCMEVYRREPEGGWCVETLTEPDTLRLDCLDAELTFDQIYEDVPTESMTESMGSDSIDSPH